MTLYTFNHPGTTDPGVIVDAVSAERAQEMFDQYISLAKRTTANAGAETAAAENPALYQQVKKVAGVAATLEFGGEADEIVLALVKLGFYTPLTERDLMIGELLLKQVGKVHAALKAKASQAVPQPVDAVLDADLIG